MDENNKVQESENRKKCFIITPIGNENSDTFRKAKGVIESVIKPVLKEYGFYDIKPAYEINVSGMINTQIINRIIDDDLVISNLTGNNPNVMYELCLRHVVAKPIIHICEEGTTLPFDIKDNRTIFYTNDMLGVEELKANMVKFMKEIEYDAEYMDNPIYSAYRYGKLLKETQGTETNEVLKMLIDISGKISEMKTESQTSMTSYAPYIEYPEPEYIGGEFHGAIRNITKVKMEKVKRQYSNRNMNVHELARELNTTTKIILDIAAYVGVDATNARSVVEYEDMNKILNYIYDFGVKS